MLSIRPLYNSIATLPLSPKPPLEQLQRLRWIVLHHTVPRLAQVLSMVEALCALIRRRRQQHHLAAA
jgi:hypothetical protein